MACLKRDAAVRCFVCVWQEEKIKELCDVQSWEGVQIVHDLPGRGRGVKATRRIVQNEVVCNYAGPVLQHKKGKKKFEETPEHAMGFMFQFTFHGAKLWVDATEEAPGPYINQTYFICKPMLVWVVTLWVGVSLVILIFNIF